MTAITGEQVLVAVEAFALGCVVQTPTRERMVADAIAALSVPDPKWLQDVAWEVWPGIGWAMEFTYGSVWGSDDGRLPGAVWWLDAIWRREASKASVRRDVERRARDDRAFLRAMVRGTTHVPETTFTVGVDPARERSAYTYSVKGKHLFSEIEGLRDVIMRGRP